jgi:hypothetical protein
MKANDEIYADISRFQEHLGLKPGADIQMLLLKAHLLIEELLQSMIESLVRCPDELSDARFTFQHSLCLAKALRDPSILPELVWVWDGVRHLNSVRNLMAHKINPKGFEEKLEVLMSMVEGNLPLRIKAGTGEEHQLAKLGLILSLLGSYLSKLVRANTNTLK